MLNECDLNFASSVLNSEEGMKEDIKKTVHLADVHGSLGSADFGL